MHTEPDAIARFWSFFAEKTQDKLGIDLDAVRSFAGQYADTRITAAPSAGQ